MAWHDVNGLRLFRFSSFPSNDFVHAISTRDGGVSPPPYDTLNLSLATHDEPQRVYENRRRFAEALDGDPARLVASWQVHSDGILQVDDGFDPAGPLSKADIQITDRAGWLLSLRFADCVPLLMVHPDRRVVAVTHAGWRGTLKQAARKAVLTLRERYAADPSGLWVGIGPSIGPCCYEVGEEVARQFADHPGGVIRTLTSRPHLDLQELNRQAVLSADVPPGQIEMSGLCTRCRVDLFFSHRANGLLTGRFAAAIGLR